jgi:hypothetical protein
MDRKLTALSVNGKLVPVPEKISSGLSAGLTSKQKNTDNSSELSVFL